jgi:hypothetical protein
MKKFSQVEVASKPLLWRQFLPAVIMLREVARNMPWNRAQFETSADATDKGRFECRPFGLW